jgi:hypothetical protein
MAIKLCFAIFSTNRPEYLVRALASQCLLTIDGFEVVDRILIDDFPLGRDDDAIRRLAASYGYRHVILHKENRSVGATWQELWNLIKPCDYDYVWHQEDDAVIIEPVCMSDLVDLLAAHPELSQIVLKRKPWYSGELPSIADESDFLWRGFRGEFNGGQYYFASIASLYPMERVRVDYQRWYREHYPHEPIFHCANINEALIGKVLLEGFGLRAMHVKTAAGGPLLEHIGKYTVGKKVLPHEPGFAHFAGFDPIRRYSSITGRLWDEGV